LALHLKLLGSARAEVQRELGHWQKDPDLASIRDEAALTSLPAKEREAFIQLWANVAKLLKKAQMPAEEEGKR
jgi:hypothetical protein